MDWKRGKARVPEEFSCRKVYCARAVSGVGHEISKLSKLSKLAPQADEGSS